MLPHDREHLLDRLRHDESVLGDGAEVVVDVDDDSEFLAVLEANPHDQVVTVAEYVHHLDAAVGLRLGEARQPLGKGMAAIGEVTTRPGPEQLVGGELGDRGEERRGLEPVDLGEGLHQLVQAQGPVASGSDPVEGSPRTWIQRRDEA